VKVFDAGNRLLLSGGAAADVQQALEKYVHEGAHVVTPVCRIGKAWTAACTIPPRKENLDDTDTLALAAVNQAIAAKKDDLDDGCRVEELGLKRLLYGPSRLAVQRRVEHMEQFGARLVGQIEQVEGEWVALCDMGGVDSSYRW
jgi:hypothetical protein